MNTQCTCELCWMDGHHVCAEFIPDPEVPSACTVCWHDEPCHAPKNPLVRPDNG